MPKPRDERSELLGSRPKHIALPTLRTQELAALAPGLRRVGPITKTREDENAKECEDFTLFFVLSSFRDPLG